jgi:hypothetical protein
VDEIGYRVPGSAAGAGLNRVQVTIRDPYESHPAEARATPGIHELMERQKTRGSAKDFLVESTGVAELPTRKDE